jgi:hypothetical protein
MAHPRFVVFTASVDNVLVLPECGLYTFQTLALSEKPTNALFNTSLYMLSAAVEESDKLAAFDSFELLDVMSFLHEARLITAARAMSLPELVIRRKFIETIIWLIHSNASLKGLFCNWILNAQIQMYQHDYQYNKPYYLM